jgi:hypothetical protein
MCFSFFLLSVNNEPLLYLCADSQLSRFFPFIYSPCFEVVFIMLIGLFIIDEQVWMHGSRCFFLKIFSTLILLPLPACVLVRLERWSITGRVIVTRSCNDAKCTTFWIMGCHFWADFNTRVLLHPFCFCYDLMLKVWQNTFYASSNVGLLLLATNGETLVFFMLKRIEQNWLRSLAPWSLYVVSISIYFNILYF